MPIARSRSASDAQGVALGSPNPAPPGHSTRPRLRAVDAPKGHRIESPGQRPGRGSCRSRSASGSSALAALLLGVLVAFAAPARAELPPVLYTEPFEAYGTPGEPPGWFDSAPGNPSQEAPGQWKTWPDPIAAGNAVFGHRGASESFTHYRVRTFSVADGFRFEGRMVRTKSQGRLGVVFFSSFPNRRSFYRVAQRDGGTVKLDRQSDDDEEDDLAPAVEQNSDDEEEDDDGHFTGRVDAGFSLTPNVWYRFVIEAAAEAGGVRVRAKLWRQGQAEPSTWSIDALDARTDLPSGWIGLWAKGSGEEDFDDLSVRGGAAADRDPPVVRVLDSGVPIADGALFARAVTPVIEVIDASAVTSSATLDGAAFTSGTPVEGEGSHTLAVTATDAAGNATALTVHFAIDREAPVFGAIAPPSGSVIRDASVILTGGVSGATVVTVDGVAATLASGSFTTPALALAEGERTFLIVAVDAAGNRTERLHSIVRDSLPPAIALSAPTAAVVGASPIAVTGTAIDAHLAAVTVNGRAATLAPPAFSLADLALAPGSNDLVVRAVDAVGNESILTRTVVLDGDAPAITVTESGAPFVSGARFHRDVVPVIAVVDATATRVEILLDGAPFASGQTVSSEGAHQLTVEAFDAAGHRAFLAIDFSIDRTPPVLSELEPADGSLVGSPTVVVRGRASGAASVTVDGQLAALSPDERFESPPLALPEGESALAIVAEDAAGNRALATLRLERDATAPVLVVTEPTEGAVLSSAAIAVAGTVSDSHLSEVRVQGIAALVVDTSFRRDGVALDEGANALVIEARDGAGNVTRVERHVTRDDLAPVVRILTAGVEIADGQVFAHAITISVDVEDATATTLELQIDGRSAVSGATISADGRHTIAATATDAAGNRTARAIEVEIDATAPQFVTVVPADGALQSAAEVTLTGRVRDAVRVTVDGAPATLAGEDWTAGPFALAEGVRTFALAAFDAAGNRADRTLRVERDATAPTISIGQPAAGAVLGTSAVAVLGSASDAHLSEVTVNGVRASVTGSSYLAAQVPLAEGETELVARAVDAAGNAAEARRTVVLDATAPVITILDPAPGTVVAAATIEVSGRAVDAHPDRVEVAGVRATLVGESFHATVPLSEGTNTLVARAIDRLGRSAEATIEVERRSTAPRIEIETPAEGARVSSATIEVGGTVEERPGLTVTVAGVAATVTAGRFVVAGVPLADGENRLIARARDGVGNEGVHTRVVVRDGEAPRFVGSDPASGALALAPATVFRLTFSEEMASPAAGAIALAVEGGSPLAIEIEVAGADLLVRPLAPLPGGAALTLALSTALADRAGNALAAPVELDFRVADRTAPSAPVLDAQPEALCAEVLALTGHAEAGATIVVEGGAGAARGTAGADGGFSVAVALVPNALARLSVVAVDALGNRSTPAGVDVLVDCVAPIVVAAERTATAFVASFSEEIVAASAADALHLSAAGEELAGAIAVAPDGRSASFVPEAMPPFEVAARFEVGTAIRDRAGNALAYPYVRRFGGSGGQNGESFFAGTALDAATGRPLAGARVVVEATDGATLAEPRPEQTTDAEGRFQIALPAGAHRVAFARPGYAGAWRSVATASGSGVDVFDPRLTPQAPAATLGAAGGTAQGTAIDGQVARLSVPAGALAAPTAMSVTPLEEQALPLPLPLGWSPRGAALVEWGGAPLSTPATLHLPVAAPDGTELVLAAFVPAGSPELAWRAVGLATVEGGGVEISVAAPGGYAAVDPDRAEWGAIAPPPAVAGAPLSGVAAAGEVVAASLVFDPVQVLPGQRSEALVTYSIGAVGGVEPPSGLPLTLDIREELALLDGGLRREAPYAADLALYREGRDGPGAPRSRFGLRPSTAASLLPIEVGREDVAVRAYGAGAGAGNVVGIEGGGVSSAEGDRLDVPAGALEQPTPIVLARRAAADLPLALPAGLDVRGILRLDLSGRTLRLPAALSLDLGAPPASGRDGVLLAVVDRGAGPVLTAVALLQPTASGWTTVPIDAGPAGLALPGVRAGGFYLFVETAPLGVFAGTVFGTSGVAGAPQEGIEVSAAGLPWVQVSAADGRYALPAPVGSSTVAARDRASGDGVEVASAIPAAGARVALDLVLATIGPRLLASTPANGATGVPVGIEPTLTFSEPIARLGLEQAIRLVETATAETNETELSIDLTVDGALVRVVPGATLRPGVAHELRVGSGVVDLQGHALENPTAIGFTVAAAAPPSTTLDLSKVFLVEPDAQGYAHVIGRPGAVPAGSVVVAENATALAATPSVEVGADGSFELMIAASAAGVTDTILLHVLRPGANEVIVELGPYLASDLRGATIGPRGGRFTTVDGFEVGVEAGTFAAPTRVRIAPEPAAIGDGPALSAALAPVAGFALDFNGAEAAKPLEIALPRPAGLSGDGPFLALREVEALGTPGWMLVDLLRGDGARLTTAEAVGGTAPTIGTVVMAEPDELSAAAAARPKSYLPGVAFPGTYRIAAPTEPIGFLAAPFAPGGGFVIGNGDLEGIFAVVDRTVARLLDFAAVLLPARLGRPAPLVIRDLSTGFRIFDGEVAPPATAGVVTVLPADSFGDRRPPLPVDGSPIRFIVLAAGSDAPDLPAGLDATFAEGQLRVRGSAGGLAPLAEGTELRLLGLDDTASAGALAGADGAVTVAVPAVAGRRYLLAIGARIDVRDALEIAFDEALGEEVAGISVRDASGHPVGLEVVATGARDGVRIVPASGWLGGKTYELELGPTLADAAGNAWGKRLAIHFTVIGSEVLDTYPLAAVRDVARLGRYLFVAADRQGLVVLDASDPRHLKNAVPGDVTFPFAFDDPVRAVAIDAHARVLVAGGGVATFGQLKIFDPLRFDPAAIAANPGDPDIRYAAFRGSTLLSDALSTDTGTQLPEGTPRKITVLSNDRTDRFRAGATPPAGTTATLTGLPIAGATVTLTLEGDGATPGAPVSLKDLTRGRFHRVVADGDGHFSLALAVIPGDELELLRNERTLAYVATQGAGIEVVDVNAFFEQPERTTPRDLLGIYSGYQDPTLLLCSAPVSDLGAALIDLDGLFDGDNLRPLSLFGAIGERGLAVFESNPAAPGQVSFLVDQCAEVDGSRQVAGLEVLARYPVDLDRDGAITEAERRDLALLAHRAAGVLVYDVTVRDTPRLVGRVRLPGAVAITADRAGRRLFVSVAGEGLAIVDFDRLPGLDPVDVNNDGIDDRIGERIALPGNTNAPAFVVPELGLAFAGGLDRGVTSLAIGTPSLRAVAAVPVAGSGGSGINPIGINHVVPYGVEVGAPGDQGTFVLQALLPGFAGEEIRLDVTSVGPGGLPIAPPGGPAAAELPPVALAGERAVVLRRQAEHLYEEGSLLYVSPPIAALADLRAAAGYARTAREEEGCPRCAAPAEAAQILSGESIAVRPTAELATRLDAVYGAGRSGRSASFALDLPSIRWEMAPSPRQEPRLNPSLGAGEVTGVLLASGELALDVVDLSIAGRGLDVAFARTYRSQTIGSGPLGPGWDFGYRMRLRALPAGDVELYDGRGRRERFTKRADGTLAAPPGLFATLERTAAGYVMIEADHTLVRFDRFGRLLAIADADKDATDTGNELRFEYDGASRLVTVIDALDRRIRLGYDTAGRLARVTDFGGREVTYGYDAAGRLDKVTAPKVTLGLSTFPEGRPTIYQYTPSAGDLAARVTSGDNLASVIDARLETPLAVEYGDEDADGRVDEVASETWGAGTARLTYDFAAGETTVRDRREQVSVVHHDAAGHATRRRDPKSAAWTFEYDGEGLLRKETRPLGGRTEWIYRDDAPRRSRGNVREVVETADARGGNGSPAVRTTRIDYEPRTNQPTWIVDARAVTTRIERDALGRPQRIVRGLGTPEESATRIVRYNAFGQPEEIVDPEGRTTRRTYFAAGPSRGYLESTTRDATGLELRTGFETDRYGRPTATIDPRGVRTETDWNEADWPIETRRGASASSDGAPALSIRTRIAYDAVGHALETREADGDAGTAELSIRRTFGVLGEVLTETRPIAAGSEATTTWTYDANLNVTRIERPNGQVTTIEPDPRNQPAVIHRGVGTPAETTEVWEHDAEGNRTSRLDGRLSLWETIYDGYGRVAAEKDPLGNAAETAYDAGDLALEARSKDVTGTLLARTLWDHDPLGRTRQESRELWQGAVRAGVQTLATRFTYDRVGNVKTTTDPLGRTTTHVYDTAHRWRKTIDALGNEVEVELDGQGNARTTTRRERVPSGPMIDVAETATYDVLGRPLATTDALGNTVQRIWDARSRLRYVLDAENALTEQKYDGLDRLIERTRPTGIVERFGWDQSSRLLSYQDVSGHETAATYDALDRVRSRRYPDGTERSFGYDAAGNVTRFEDALGTVTDQVYDAANRLTTRTITPAPGVIATSSETYTWDGLSRLTRAEVGADATTWTYDSLSRALTDQQNSKVVARDYDAVGNATALHYPSGRRVDRTYDALDRPERLSDPLDPSRTIATYGYRGADLVAEQTLGGLIGRWRYDGARRPIGRSYVPEAGGAARLAETLTYSPRHQLTSIVRGDLNGRGSVFGYDAAGQLAGKAARLGPSLPNNAPSAGSPLAADGIGEAFTFDRAQNLIERTERFLGLDTPVALPVDASGRNRPGSVNGQALTWDANGNLKRKGDLHFAYDDRNRLRRVLRGIAPDVVEIASYDYDALNRRIRRRIGGLDGTTLTTAWDGWRAIEEIDDQGIVQERKVYGLGLDEIVERETPNGAGRFDRSALMYGATGDPALLVQAETGKPIERYATTAHGERGVFVDAESPETTQVSAAPSEIRIELSEEAKKPEAAPSGSSAPLKAGARPGLKLASGLVGIELVEIATGTPIALAADLAPEAGPGLERRRLVLSPNPPPAPGTQVRLTIQPEALEDFFANRPDSAQEWTFVWPASGRTIVADTGNPELVRAVLRDGRLEATFTKEVTASGLAQAATIDGQPSTWTVSPDGLVATTTEPLPAGPHHVTFGTGAIDLGGKGLAEAIDLDLESPGEQRDSIGLLLLLEAFDKRLVQRSPTGQQASFQGHPVDEETGFVYLRNRYYDPEIGRFITADPLGFPDGPSGYAFGAGDPVNGRDPLGLETGTITNNCVGKQSRCGVGPGLASGTGKEIASEIVSLATMPWAIAKATAREAGAYVGAFQAGGMAGVIEESEERAAARRAVLPEVLPIWGTARQIKRAYDSCRQGPLSECGEQATRAVVRAAADATLIRSAVRLVSAADTSAIYQTALDQTFAEVATEGGAALGVPNLSVATARTLANIAESKAARSASGFGIHVQRSATVQTPHGVALQDLTQSGLSLRNQVLNGERIFRSGNYPRSFATEGQYWAFESPLNPGYAQRTGAATLGADAPSFVMGGTIRSGTQFVVRRAPPYGANAGGGWEVVVEPHGVRVDYFVTP